MQLSVSAPRRPHVAWSTFCQGCKKAVWCNKAAEGTGGGGVGDMRVEDAMELRGPEANALLERLAEEHGEIRQLMETFPATDG